MYDFFNNPQAKDDDYIWLNQLSNTTN